MATTSAVVLTSSLDDPAAVSAMATTSTGALCSTGEEAPYELSIQEGASGVGACSTATGSEY